MSIHKKEYDTLLTDEKRRRERNIRLLAKLENIEKKATFLQAKTDRIKSLKSIYKNKFDKNGIPIFYTSRDERLKCYEGINIPVQDEKSKNTYYDKFFELQEPYDMKSKSKSKCINSCYITKNITLEEAIEEISRRFVLIPKTPGDINIHDEKLNKISKNDADTVIKTQPEVQSDITHAHEPEKVVSQNKVDFIIDKIHENVNERQETEVEESHSKEFDYIENKEEDLSEIEFQNMQIQNEEEKCENNVAPIEVSQEISETEESQLENQNDSIHSKLKHLSSEIAHVDQMGIENNYNDNNIVSQEEIGADNGIKHSEDLILNEKLVDELQQENSNENIEEIIPNTNEEILENLNQNTNDSGENYENQYEQENNEYIQPNIDQQQPLEQYEDNDYIQPNIDQQQPLEQYENNDYIQPNIDQQQPLEQYENNDANYVDETSNDQFNAETSNYDQTELYNSQTAEENVSQEQPIYTEEKYYENPDNYDQAADQNEYNAENVSQYEGTYDQNQANNDDNYAYDNNTEQVTNEYVESNEQGEYQNYTEQNNVESEQYNNYEPQEDSQYYDETTIEDSPIKDVQPDTDVQNSSVKPLQILDSDTDPVSLKEETSVQESDFDFSTQ
ncbi:uncharacterized protein LOC143911419 [Arctopsyche grandis]|uniref:uncharacterized protein LOC143911419 n=1 Tax=Arctopsyche grandis TaxID=121162 RepID=UPI00406D9418